ncbi:unnamed protein product [Prorocentrum cordatum]|uniref:Uncharacterized protein n=1 Tax=Prorocentrum cordatum TaxID=2364126 RepID=A0ABN9VST3_9DINO|nr:unnamed protein product [Polarella glacialis]
MDKIHIMFDTCVCSVASLGPARTRRASNGRWLWRYGARCRRQSWSLTPISYNAGISACEKGEQWQRALALLSEMREAKLDPDVISYNVGISACEKGQQWQRALALLSEMLEAKLEPDIISYNAGISACEKGEQWQRALALLSEMWEAKLDPDVISTTLQGPVRARRAQASATALGSARARRASSGSWRLRC